MRIKELRVSRDMTQHELAKKLGITQQMLSLYESGKSQPDSYLIKELCAFFDVSADYLLSITDIRRTANIDNILDKFEKLEIQTIAAHHDGNNEFTEEELEEIENFKQYVLEKKRKKLEELKKNS